MIRIILSLCLGVLTPHLLAEVPPPPPRQSAPTQSADGRIEIPDTGFSMLPPPNWEVLLNSHGSTLLFRGPKGSGEVSYQSTIQVMVFQGYRYIDEVTLQEYGKLIVDKFSVLSNQVQNYRLRSAETVKLETGDESILYYTEFSYGDIPIMQMHILTSSASHHFLMTYTDLASSFEEDNNKGLTTAYTSMHSAVLRSHPPSRYTFAIFGGGGFLAFIIVWFGFRYFRSYQMSRLGERMEDEDNREVQADQETEYYSRQTLISEATPLDDIDDDEDQGTRSRKRTAKTKSSVMPPKKSKAQVEDEDDEIAEDELPAEAETKDLHNQPKRRTSPRHLSELEPLSDMKHLIKVSEIESHFPEPSFAAPQDEHQNPRGSAAPIPAIKEAKGSPPPIRSGWMQPDVAAMPEKPSAPRLSVPPQVGMSSEAPPMQDPRLAKTIPPSAPPVEHLNVPPTPPAEGVRTTVPPTAPQAGRATIPPGKAASLDLESPTQHSEVAQISDLLPQDGTEDKKKGKKKRGLFWGKDKKKSKDESDIDDDEDLPEGSDSWAVAGSEEFEDDSELMEVPDDKLPMDEEDDEPEVKAMAKVKAKAKSTVKAPKEEPKAKNNDKTKKKPKDEEQRLSAYPADEDGESDEWNLSAANKKDKEADDEEEVS